MGTASERLGLRSLVFIPKFSRTTEADASSLPRRALLSSRDSPARLGTRGWLDCGPPPNGSLVSGVSAFLVAHDGANSPISRAVSKIPKTCLIGSDLGLGSFVPSSCQSRWPSTHPPPTPATTLWNEPALCRRAG